MQQRPETICAPALRARRRTPTGAGAYARSFYSAVAAVFLFSFLVLAPAPGSFASEADERLADQFMILKDDFESRVAELAGNQEELAFLGAATAARAWALAAVFSAESEADRRRWEERLDYFNSGERVFDELENRQLEAVLLFYDAFYESSLSLARKGGLRSFESRLRAIRSEARDKLEAVKDRPGAVWEKKTIVSEAAALLALATSRTMGGAPMRRPTDEIMARLQSRTAEIEKRTDIHYRARMRLLYQLRLRELTSLVFLMGLSAGPPISGQMAAIHAELNRNAASLVSETHSEGLIWTAQAQASIPLAYWVATVRREEAEGYRPPQRDEFPEDGRDSPAMLSGKKP